MFVAREWAIAHMSCPLTGHQRKKCLTDDCMAWREQTLFASLERDEAERAYVRWTLEEREGATAVDCGYCGMAGPPTGSRSIKPIGYDDDSLGNCALQSRTRRRALSKAERKLAERRGIIPTLKHETPELPKRPSYYFPSQRGRGGAR